MPIRGVSYTKRSNNARKGTYKASDEVFGIDDAAEDGDNEMRLLHNYSKLGKNMPFKIVRISRPVPVRYNEPQSHSARHLEPLGGLVTTAARVLLKCRSVASIVTALGPVVSSLPTKPCQISNGVSRSSSGVLQRTSKSEVMVLSKSLN